MIDLKELGLVAESHLVEVTVFLRREDSLINNSSQIFFLFPSDVLDFVTHFDFSKYIVTFSSIPVCSVKVCNSDPPLTL